MSDELVLLEIAENRVATLTLNDPEKRNAMGEEMAAVFSQRVADLRTRDEIRVVVLRGAGKAFSGGGNLDMLEAKTKLSKEENRQLMVQFYDDFLSIRSLDIPLIAAVNGHAIGAGLCIALACDIRICSSVAKLGLNFVRLGLHPGMGATYFLPRLVGPEKAAELLYQGSTISAEEAKALGMVSTVVDPVDFENEVARLSSSIASAGPQSIRALKSSLRDSETRSLKECLAREAECQALDYISSEFAEGIRAAKEKRTPSF